MGLRTGLLRACRLSHRSNDEEVAFPVDAWTDEGYDAWFCEHQPTEEELGAQRAAHFDSIPKFSIIVPLYKTPLAFLADMVTSVLAQTYSHFELLLVNASADDADLKHEVKKLCASDTRVKEIILDCNGGITENTNAGIVQATGDYICFLDHDDFIEPHTLFEYAQAVNKEPTSDVLYCDEDMVEIIDGQCRHLHPLFKPAFSPELLLCKNYAMHFLAIRRSIVQIVEEFTCAFDGSQDYNMLLNSSERARMVTHVPQVLYHWRISDTSTATNPESKPYTKRSNRLSIKAHLDRTSQHASIFSSGIPNLHNLWFNPPERPLVSVVLVQTGSDEQLDACLEAFTQSNTYRPYEVILVSDHKPILSYCNANMSVKWVESFCNQLQGHVACLNAGARVAQGEYLLFWGDTLAFLSPEPVEQLLGLCLRESIGAVAPKTLYAGGEVRYYGIAITSERIMPLYRGYADDFPGYLCNIRCFQNVSALSYEGLFTARHLFAEVGGFDESYRGVISSVDYCKRLLSEGYRMVQTPTVKVESTELCPKDRYNNAVNSPDFYSEDTKRFYQVWPEACVGGDPFFNRNFDQASCYMQIAKS